MTRQTLFLLIVLGDAAIVPARGDDAPANGAVEGTLTYRGKIPQADIADQAGRKRDLLSVHAKNNGLADAVVFINLPAAKPGEQRPAPPKNDSSVEKEKSVPAKPALVIDQKDFYFVPHVAAVRAGEPVKFTNSDFANHNVHADAFETKNSFNIVTGTGGDYTHRFRVERRNRPIRLGCDIHRWMSGWIYIFDHPHYAVTDADGKFKIAGLPAGKHKLSIRQPDGGFSADREIEVSAEKTARVEVEFTEKDLRLD